MAEEEEQNQPSMHPRRRHRGRTIFFVFVLLLVAAFFGLFYSFNYFGERFLRKYLQDKISKASNGLYHADFRTLHVNILTGKVSLDSFELIPDTVRYNMLKSTGKVATALYRVSFSSLVIDKVHFRQIYAGKRINFRQLTMQQPVISIIGFPDTVKAKRNRWRVIYEDLYPAVSGLFNDFHIDSVKVNHGMFLTSFREKTGRKTTGEYEFSSVLRDVSVNPFSYYNRERVFYSRDVELVIHNFESELADSLYALRAEEIGFSLTRSVLYGKKVSLIPNLGSRKKTGARSGDLYHIELPSFSISGVDLYRAMTGREVEISSVLLSDFFIRVYRNQPPPGIAEPYRHGKKLTLAGLYTVVAKELRFIAIDTLKLKNGSFEFFGNPADKRPELRIGEVSLEMDQFRLDSLTYADPSRIFYSRAIELALRNISLYLRDGIHCINASAVSFSTLKSLIDVQEATIFPDRQKNRIHSGGSTNMMFVNLPRLTFSGIDLKKVFNRRILDFESLVILEPEVRYTRFHGSKNPDPRFRKPGDFFEAENEEVVYDLLKKYLWVIRGNAIDIQHGLLKYSIGENGQDLPLATSSFDLSMDQFLIDSVHGMNEQGYFYSRDFDLTLQSVAMVSPDSLKHLHAGRVHVATRDSLIEAENIHIIKTANPLKFVARSKNHTSLAFEFSLQKLRFTGLNHKKLFLEKNLKASQVEIDNPELFIKTSRNLQPAGPPEMSQLLKTNRFVQSFEIGRCLVRKGALTYDGEEDRKATYFSLKDIEFAVADAMVQLPERGIREGTIKFDSLRLTVFPLRVVLADSNYALEAQSLEVHSYPADILIRGIRVTPLKSWDEVPGRKAMATITIPEVRLNGFYFDRAIFNNQWLLNSLLVTSPAVSYEMRQALSGAAEKWHFDPSGLFRFPPFIKTLAVNSVAVDNADVGLTLHRDGKTDTYRFQNIMLKAIRFRADSATRANPGATPLFNAQDVTLSMPGISVVSADSMYTFSVGRLGFSTMQSSAFLDSLTILPNFSRARFSEKTGHQTDRIALKIPRIQLSQVDFPTLLRDRELHAEKLTLDGLVLEDYLDKRAPPRPAKRTLMPGRAVAGIRFPAKIDTILFTNGFASYEEQTGDEPGRVFFDGVNATLSGFSTLSGSERNLDLHATANLMGLGATEAWLRFLPDHPRDSFTMRARIGELDLTAVNPMLSKLVPASIRQGKTSAIEVVELSGNNAYAVGKMRFMYNNLFVKLHPTKPGTWNRVEQSLLTEALNLLLANSNPNDDGRMKHGMIYFERDTSKGFFNFVWKSALSGIKSSVGINTKIQKNMLRQTKTRKYENENNR